MPRPDPSLIEWVGDAARREATRSRRRALARDWQQDTPLEALERSLDALADPSAEAVAALIVPLLEDAGWLDTVVARLATAAREDDFLDPPLTPVDGPVQRGLMLYQGRHAALFAGVGARDRIAAKRLRPRSGTLAFTGTYGLMRVVRSGGARLSLWRGGWHEGVLRERCEAAGEHRLRDGEVLAIDGRTTAFIVEHVTGEMVLLQATILAGAAPTTCEYDVTTGDLVATGAARDDASRMQMLATLLAALEVADHDAFDRASRRPEPFARWHAMRCWLALDTVAAAPRLAAMARHDPDAEIRALAEKVLTSCPA